LLMIFWLRLDDGRQRPIGAMIRKHLCIPCSGALEPRSNHINLRETKLVVVGSGVKDHLNWTTTGGYPTIINIGCPDLATLE
jgi:hypothetical protein